SAGIEDAATAAASSTAAVATDASSAAGAKPIVDAAVRAANATLGPQQRIAGWRRWPDDDFPRTHTLKIRRDPIRAWATEASGDTTANAAGTAGTAGTADEAARPAAAGFNAER
ncbi:MAG: hypothetical protein QOF49_389, partial [Chloroflexota bacterium]|nr:hypothetical protein [Chloroflexota bacterium]